MKEYENIKIVTAKEYLEIINNRAAEPRGIKPSPRIK
jgi:hypothetical protein